MFDDGSADAHDHHPDHILLFQGSLVLRQAVRRQASLKPNLLVDDPRASSTQKSSTSRSVDNDVSVAGSVLVGTMAILTVL